MNTVWKYNLGRDLRTTLDLPRGATFCRAAIQGDRPCMWFQVNTAEPSERRRFLVVGTGRPIRNYKEHGLSYLESFTDGPFEWHLFEIGGQQR